MRLRCNQCGKSVSNEVSGDTVVRAWLECPECVEKKAEERPETASTDPRVPSPETMREETVRIRKELEELSSHYDDMLRRVENIHAKMFTNNAPMKPGDVSRFVRALIDGWTFGPLILSKTEGGRHTLWAKEPVPKEGVGAGGWVAHKVDSKVSKPFSALLDEAGVP